MSAQHVENGFVRPTCSTRLHRLFSVYLGRYFTRHFNAVRLSRSGSEVPGTGPVVVHCNHPSWWDPILVMVVAHELFPGWKGYGPIDADMLEKYGFFKRLGAFGVDRDTRRGARDFLRKSLAVLSERDAVLWLTPQGRFSDPRERPLRFEPGLGHVLRRTSGVVAQSMAIELAFWTERLPELLIRFGAPLVVDDGRQHTAAEWTAALEENLENNMDALADEVIARDPAAFRTVLRGRSGVGGVYDGWRRLKAVATGRPFSAAHLDDDA